MGGTQSANALPSRHDWLVQSCRCSVCGQTLIVSDGGMVLCFWPGHTRSSSPETFAATITAAWRAARKRQIVNLSETRAINMAWRLVRGATAAGWSDAAGVPVAAVQPEAPALFAVRD